MPSFVSFIAANAEVTKRLGRYAFTTYQQFPALAQRTLRKIWNDNRTSPETRVFELQFSQRDGEVWMGLAIPHVGTLWNLRIDSETAQSMTLALIQVFTDVETEAGETRARARRAYVILKSLDQGQLVDAVTDHGEGEED